MAADQAPATAGDGTRVTLDELIALRQEARGLDLRPRGKVLATRSGGHLSRFRGRGMEFDESRVYQPGDEPRNMDWRVTARTGTAHVKLFREERERPVWLIVDQGRSMCFGTRVAFKSVVATRAAALLGWAAADQGDRVGGIVFDPDRSVQCPPAAGQRGLLGLLHALSSPPQRNRQGGYPSLADAATRSAPLLRSGSLVFVLSDFRGLDDTTADWMARLARTGELVLIQLYDALEATPPPPGLYPVTDGRRRMLVDAAVAEVRADWRSRFAAHSAIVERLCRQHGAHLIRIATDAPLVEALRLGMGPARPVRGAIR